MVISASMRAMHQPTCVEHDQDVVPPDPGQGEDPVVVPLLGDGHHALDAGAPRDEVDDAPPGGVAVVQPVGEVEDQREGGRQGEHHQPHPPVEGADKDGLVLLDLQRHQARQVVNVDRDGVVDDLGADQGDAKGSWKKIRTFR